MHNFLDLDRYRLDQPESAEWQALVDRCRSDLAGNGMFNLDGLMDAQAANAAAQSLRPKFETESFHHQREHNVYFTKTVPGLAEDHPALARFRTSNHTLCADQLAGTPIDDLYRWPEFALFLAAYMNKPALYIMADQLAGLNAMSYHEGQQLNWHFDRSEFTTTMLMQAPQIGGEFLYRTDLRSADNPNYDGVAKLLRGEDAEMRSMSVSPGTINVFRGKNTPHRVAPVRGPDARVIAVFSYFEKPGVTFSDEERIGFYGRAA